MIDPAMPTQNEVEKAYKRFPISSIVEAFFQGTDKMRHFIITVMEPVLTGQVGLDDREAAIAGTYYRVVGWLKALGELNALGHYQAVASGARSLFELLLDLKLIQSDRTGEMVKKFHAFPEVEKYRVAQKLVSYCDKTSNTNTDCAVQRAFVDGAAKAAEINSLVIEHWGTNRKGKPIWPLHWSGLTIADRSKKLGAYYEELYVELYPILSWHIHSGSTGYVSLKPETLESTFGFMHGTIQKIVLDATEICADLMKIDRMDNLTAGFKSNIEDLRKSTDQILVQKCAELHNQRSVSTVSPK